MEEAEEIALIARGQPVDDECESSIPNCNLDYV
jgi:hypothetical protein